MKELIFKTTGTVHKPKPDYSKTQFEMDKEKHEKIFQRLVFLYGRAVAKAYMPEMERILKVYYAHKTDQMIEYESVYNPSERFTEKDIILITYGDILRGKEKSPLSTLAKFCDIYLNGSINTLHILPFYPYSSDKGFSIIDFQSVDPKLGTWEDIEKLEDRYQLMFDGVINHVSSENKWFQEFLNGQPYFKDFFIAYDSPDELSFEDRRKIFRPRTSDLLSKFETINGLKHVWTTFSSDQIDLNYKNPNVLMRVLEVLLLYVRHGADIIRLDAVTYLWCEPGTKCIHLKQTHEIVKLFRDILDAVAPGVALITETNVPHEENISYFGNGLDEAQMVYNFALPPLVLHTFYSEDSTDISKWVESLDNISPTTTFFNFLDSHDGVGLMGVKNLLSKDQIQNVVDIANDHGGFISYKTTSDGGEEPYEINITWYSAINKEDDADLAFQVKKFVASRSIALVIQGVPGIYLHGLLGTENDIEAVKITHSKRDINRTILDSNMISFQLGDGLSKISRIERELGHLLNIRTKRRAFHPNGEQKIIFLEKQLFALQRTSPENDEHIYTITNVSNQTIRVTIDLPEIGFNDNIWRDLVSGTKYLANRGKIDLTIYPYDIIWLQPEEEIKEEIKE